MAKSKTKKKKSKGSGGGVDSRGYSSGAAARKVEVTSKAHEGLTNLLGDLKAPSPFPDKQGGASSSSKQNADSVPKSTIIDPTSKRFLKKVENIHDKLFELSFKEEQIESSLHALGASGSEFDLEAALDWLCLHLPSEDLPALFTEANVRISALGEDEGEITVVKTSLPPVGDAQTDASNTGNFHESASELIDLVAAAKISDTAIGKLKKNESYSQDLRKEDAADKANRDWLLERYQYEEDSNDVAEDQVDVKALSEEDAAVHEELTPEERRLGKLEMQLEEEKHSLNDDAANYMRSKQEIIDLKRQVKKLEGQVKGLRSKVAKSRAAKERSLEDATQDVNEKDEDEGNIMSLFGDAEESEDDNKKSNSMEGSSEGKKSSVGVLPPALDDVGRKHKNMETSSTSVTKDWTGKTPKKILEEWCQKRKLPKPQFYKLPGSTNGCRIVVQRQSQMAQKSRSSKKPTEEKALIIENPGPFHSFLDSHHYLATEALYDLNPTLPLYRLFPPIFRDNWKAWLDEKQAEKDAAIKEKQDKKKDKIGSIARSISSSASAKGVEATNAPNAIVTQEADAVPKQQMVLDSWEDDGSSGSEIGMDVAAKSESKPPVDIPSSLGKKLRHQFETRRKSPAYTSMMKERLALPMHSYRNSLLDAIRDNTVTVLCAETGAGKTTQCPQFLLEEALLSGFGDKISIVCTQPRRISALSVAERVADEMCERIGDSVGYHIRMEAKKSNKTKLLFCTTGVILRRLQDDPNLYGVTHVVVDEVHERQWQIDFLLIVLRRLINTSRPDLKVVLMSATLDSELFCTFFPGAPFFKVPGRTFPVAEYCLEDLLDATDHLIEEGSRCALLGGRSKGGTAELWVTGRGGEKHREVVSLESESHPLEVSDDYAGYKMSTRRSMDRVDEQVINYDLIEDILTLLLVKPQENDSILPPDGSMVSISKGAVLVFLPGLGEIRSLSEGLKGSRIFGDRGRFDIIPMHSTLSPKDQRRAFTKPKVGCQKIILATNICETSVTIPDVICVIDSGLVREVRQDKRSGTSTLVTDWCSRASAKQRSGRAGRVQPGICCKLFSSRTFQGRMHEQAMPELQRVPLEEVCLSILAGKLGNNCMEFLRQAPQPPSEESVQNALTLLEEVGAIDPRTSNSSQQREHLTPLGCHLSKLPVHVRLGKMLIFGALFKCLDKILTVAASLSAKSLFSTHVDNAQQAAAAHRLFAHPTSDFLTICNVWDAYQLAASESDAKGRKFCDKHYLNRASLIEINDMRNQFLELLDVIGFVKQGGSDDKCFINYNANSSKECIVSAVIVAGLYPNMAHAVKTVAGGVPALWHKKEKVYFHSSSVNHKVINLESEWVTFYEKFATSRVYISATSLVFPFSLLLFGRSVVVRHLERKAIVDDWIELKVAAQTGVAFRELRHEIEAILKEMIENVGKESSRGQRMLDGIVKLLQSEVQQR